MATLTDDIKIVLSKVAELSKTYTDTKVASEIEAAIENYSTEIGASAEELKEYIKALDSLDFNDDGILDASVVTQKIASNEAAIADLKTQIQTLSEKASKTLIDVNTFKTETTTKITDLDTRVQALESEEDEVISGNFSESFEYMPRKSYTVKNGKYFKDELKFTPSEAAQKLIINGAISYRPNDRSWYYISFDLFDGDTLVKEKLGGGWFNADYPNSAVGDIATVSPLVIDEVDLEADKEYTVKIKLWSARWTSLSIVADGDAAMNFMVVLKGGN